MVAGHALTPDQATALTALIELEARWENLPRSEVRDDLPASVLGLRAKQTAYDAYHRTLVAYNRRYRPAHAADAVVNSPARLGLWCRKVCALLRQLGDGAACPVHLLEKTYRSAVQIGLRLSREPLGRTLPADVPAAVRALTALAVWSDDLTASPVR